MSFELFDKENFSIVKFKKYMIIEKKKIGAGGFGKVFSGHYKSLPLAIKKIKNFDLKEFTKEIKIIKNFKHPRVPHLFGVCKEDKSEKLSLISELINGETLDVYLSKNHCKELEILVHLIELTKVLEFFHCNRVIHRDLKPSNIMIDHNMNLRLLDFGISKMTSNSITTTITMGTLLYMAPENFQIAESSSSSDLTTKSSINAKVDVWAFGCLIDEIFSKSKPWSPIAKDNAKIIGHLFSKTNFPVNKEKIKNKSIVELIECCTAIEPSKRFDIQQAKVHLMRILYEEVTKGFKGSNHFLDEYFSSYDAKKRHDINSKILSHLEYYAKHFIFPKFSHFPHCHSTTLNDSFNLNTAMRSDESLDNLSFVSNDVISNDNEGETSFFDKYLIVSVDDNKVHLKGSAEKLSEQTEDETIPSNRRSNRRRRHRAYSDKLCVTRKGDEVEDTNRSCREVVQVKSESESSSIGMFIITESLHVIAIPDGKCANQSKTTTIFTTLASSEVVKATSAAKQTPDYTRTENSEENCKKCPVADSNSDSSNLVCNKQNCVSMKEGGGMPDEFEISYKNIGKPLSLAGVNRKGIGSKCSDGFTRRKSLQDCDDYGLILQKPKM